MLGFGVLVHIAQILGGFGAFFGPFLGHIGELKGTRGLLDTVKSSRMCSVATGSLRLVVFEWVLRLFWGKKGLFWGTKCAVLESHLPTWRPRPGAPPVSFWLKTWIWRAHHLGSRMARVE